jgi:superfamily I DNA/RNA helicase
MTEAQVSTVLGAALQHFPVVGAPAPLAAVVREPVLEAAPSQVDLDALMTEQEVADVLLEGLLAEPIEEWMAFLHPDQAKLVRRSFNGPARIRGAAGTGKTVVGLHRAAYLARAKPEGKILFTTFIRTLPDVMRNSLARMAPEVVDRVEFRGVYEFAGSILSERGISSKLDSKTVKTAWWDAWRVASAPLKTIDSKPEYWKEEIDYVIKGRGLTQFEQYADSARIGRKRRLTIDQRREVWALYREYEQQLEKLGIHDFADRILATERTLREQPLEGYSAVIVDEAQDLSCAMVRMLWSLVGDEPDAFTLIGDGQQTIYPGGYTLAEAGISLAGRGVVLDINYRNTAEILQAAARIVDGDEFTDIEGADQLGDGIQRVSRHGTPPMFARFDTDAAHDEALVLRVRAVTREIGTGLGDVAVLCRTKAQAASATRALTAAGMPTVQLTDYHGVQVESVKIGTIKRAKGLEFKQVLLPRVNASLLTPSAVRDPDGSESLLERHERDRRELYVGMTRARDGVWIGSVGGSAEKSVS